MKIEDFMQILEELSTWTHFFTLCLMLQNEPLLDPELLEKIKLCKEHLPGQAKLIIVTNGSLINNSDILKHFMEAGLDLLGISVNSFMVPLQELGKKSFSKITFPDFIHRTGLEKFKEGIRIFSTCFKENRKQLPLILKVCEESGLDFHMSIANDRIQKAIPLDQFFKMACHSTCLRPFYSLPILSNLDVITCCHDWEHRFSIGNLRGKGIESLWNSQEYDNLRESLILSSIHKPYHCSSCQIPKELHSQAAIPILLGYSQSEFLDQHILLPRPGNRSSIIFNYATLEGFEVNMSPMELVRDLKSDISEVKKQVFKSYSKKALSLAEEHFFYNINVSLFNGTSREINCRLLKADSSTHTLFLSSDTFIKNQGEGTVFINFRNSISVPLIGILTKFSDDQLSFKVTSLTDTDWKRFLFLLKDQTGLSYQEYQKIMELFSL